MKKPNKMLNFFSFRTSYFNTNIQVATENTNPFLNEKEEDSVDNTTKKRRRRTNNQNQTQQQQDEKTTTNNNANSTVVEVTSEVQVEQEEQSEEIQNADAISDLLGHFGWWQLVWCVTLSLFQFPSTFHLFSFVFEVSEWEIFSGCGSCARNILDA